MNVAISRWGTSFGIRIPKAALEEANLHEGDRVNVAAENGKLVISKAAQPTLEELVADMTPANSYPETFSAAVGHETW